MSCRYYQPLKNNVDEIIRDDYTFPRMTETKEFAVTGVDPTKYLTQKWIKKLEPLGHLHSLLFEMKHGVDKGSIHVDLDSTNQEPFWPSLNIILQGQGTMKWFRPTVEGKVAKHETAKVFYKFWTDNYGEVLDVWNHGKVVLVRTDTPHQAYNYDNTTRLMITIRWRKKMSWDETLNFFSDCF